MTVFITQETMTVKDQNTSYLKETDKNRVHINLFFLGKLISRQTSESIQCLLAMTANNVAWILWEPFQSTSW